MKMTEQTYNDNENELLDDVLAKLTSKRDVIHFFSDCVIRDHYSNFLDGECGGEVPSGPRAFEDLLQRAYRMGSIDALDIFSEVIFKGRPNVDGELVRKLVNWYKTRIYDPLSGEYLG